MTVNDLQNINQEVSAKTLETMHSTREDSTFVLPQHIRRLQKPTQFKIKELSGSKKLAT
jgi:hypothetical protein